MNTRTRLYSRKALFLYGTLFFLIGMGLGGVLGIFSLRYMLFHRQPPSAEEMAAKTMEKIGADYTFAAGQREQITEELRVMHKDIGAIVDASFADIDARIEAGAIAIARHFADEETRTKWLKEYRGYFPRPPGPP